VRNDLIVVFGRLNPRSACVLNTIITVFGEWRRRDDVTYRHSWVRVQSAAKSPCDHSEICQPFDDDRQRTWQARSLDHRTVDRRCHVTVECCHRANWNTTGRRLAVAAAADTGSLYTHTHTHTQTYR